MQDFERIESLFHQAAILPSEEIRRQWLEMECAGDSELFHEVSTLLDARERIRAIPLEAAPLPSTQFGAYRPVRLLGRGGMSAVYLAERTDGQFQQSVALKVMAGYLADGEFFRRFECERQFLASLNHHNITRLLDGGISSGGDPFLVTEYVDGEAIDRYCDEQRLIVEDRVRVFLQVCDAVEYAHRHLIVHRDLKPANILVNREGAVKLLDFGTAALASEQAMPTVTRMRMLTPRYASPEQLRGERVNVATDIFSLGIVLYELLTGTWPYGNVGSASGEQHRAAKLLSVAVVEDTARNRSLSAHQLRKKLKGDISAVVMKAIEPDQRIRYESVSSLASDLRNWLSGRPVTAQPQTAWYRAGKFLRRQWVPFCIAALFLGSMVGATSVAIYQARAAREEALKADTVNQFLGDMLGNPFLRGFDPKTLTVAQMLEDAEARLAKKAACRCQGGSDSPAQFGRQLFGFDTFRPCQTRASKGARFVPICS